MTGATGYLECSTVGVPTPNVTLTTDAAVSCNVMLSGNRVTVTSAVAGNTGSYTCNASNFLDFDKQTSELLVGSKYCKFEVIHKRKSVMHMLLAAMRMLLAAMCMLLAAMRMLLAVMRMLLAVMRMLLAAMHSSFLFCIIIYW